MTKLFEMVNLFLWSPLLMTSMVLGQQELPYFITFKHHTADLRYECYDEFVKVHDFLYQDYVNDLIATSNMTAAIATKLDSTWSTKTYKFDATKKTDTTYNRQLQLCNQAVCNSALAIIIARGCCDFCRKSCRRRMLTETSSTDALLRGQDRQMQQLLEELVPVRDPLTGFVVVKNEGNSSVLASTSGAQGMGVIRSFYSTVQTYIEGTCRDILLGTTYRILAMNIVPK
jgi:hypothetical protein